MSAADSWPSFDLTIGELFPATDLVAQWVFTLNAVVEDIQVTLRPLKTAEEWRDRMYFYRLLITRLYEARRLIEARAKYKEIEEFVGGGLNFIGVDLIAAYTRPAPAELSPVEQLYEDSRHRTVHYPHVGRPELEGLLRDHAKLPARLELHETTAGLSVESQWVTAIRVQDTIGGAPWDPGILERIRERDRATVAIAMAWIMASGVLTMIYVKRAGIDLERVVSDPAAWRAMFEATKQQPPADV